MYGITIQDAIAFRVMGEYDCPVCIEYVNEDSIQFWIGSEFKGLSKVFVDENKSFAGCVISTLKELTPPEGTPNSEMTDDQKGLIQLLFEIEKALA